MANEALTARNPDGVHTDVLSSARQACYKARDAFYACLEKESDKKQTEIASKGLLYPAQCKPARDQFVNNCRASWVKHFDAMHCKNRSLKRLLDDKESRRGPLSLPQPYTFKPPSTS
ncbi:cytochrome c oxidase assembly factor 6 isoform X1 [Rosa chinensis]|uniref:cytochrome c oxidase assembly factor 6 isoform X1 n=1 Tax=Rosa chinensis TaxID=74649 RepID=UPI000D08BB2B|nr:cytochrome c oxidase assembly factor 6 isoform X1 [Rosa chinensis]